MHVLQERYRPQIEEMVEACHRLAERRYVASHGGNLSWRVAPDDVLITPTKVNKGRISFGDISVVGMNQQTKYAGKGVKPTGEVYIHIGILKRRADIKSIIHAHPPWMTALAISRPELLRKAFLPEPVIEVGPVALTEYAQPLTEDLARAFDPVVMRHNAFLMKNHGAVMLSVDGIGRCFDLLEMIELAAQSIAIAEMLGGAQPLGTKQVKGLTETMRVRGLSMPGAPGQVADLADLYVNETA